MAAMHPEQSAVLAALPDERRQVLAGRAFWHGHWHGHAVVAVLSGIGKVAAATTAALLVDRFGAKRIVFTGTAQTLWVTDAEQAQLAGLLIQLTREGASLFPFGNVGLDLLLDEAPGSGAGHLVRLVEVVGVHSVAHDDL